MAPNPDSRPSTSSSSSTPEPAFWGLRRGDQVFVGVLVTAGILVLTVFMYRLGGWGVPLIEIERLPARRYDYQLDINRATWVEWTLLEGIGEKLAKRIVADRAARGPFASIEDVRRVAGIGPKTWEQIRPWLMIGPTAAVAPGAVAPGPKVP